ncbi:MAG: CfrBI family restriction endonuclease [Deltaproteobacteria bacterium]|nr:CfrBI family restriction endonuclease [Deltaproteobacteria bacterium]
MKRSPEIASLIPSVFSQLVESKGADFIRHAGEDAVRDVVLDVLCGVNLRASTEALTRQRIGKLNAATFLLFLHGIRTAEDFTRRLPELAANRLAQRVCKSEKWLCQWVLGLTDKGFQNILRDESREIGRYAQGFADSMRTLADESRRAHGDLSCRVSVADSGEVVLDWHDILSLFCTIGSQTLAIRGSEKSTYGKLFERLVLGSVLSVLDFELTSHPPHKLSGVFWLSSKLGEREADATVLVAPGKAVRFDLGFIGKGNPEITKDKVSRFERDLEVGRRQYESMTIIIVDRVGRSSALEDQAKRAGAHVIQMSMNYWPKQVAQVLGSRCSYEHRVARLPDNKIADYFRSKLRSVHLEDFVRGLRDSCG